MWFLQLLLYQPACDYNSLVRILGQLGRLAFGSMRVKCILVACITVHKSTAGGYSLAGPLLPKTAGQNQIVVQSFIFSCLINARKTEAETRLPV